MVDSALSDDGVHNNAFAGRKRLDKGPGDIDLLDNQRRDVGLEASGSKAHQNQTEHEDGIASGLVGDDGWNGRYNEDDMTNNGDSDGNANGLVSSPMLICHLRQSQYTETRLWKARALT